MTLWPSCGRFISRDPIGLFGRLNLHWMKRRAALQPVSVLRPAEWAICLRWSYRVGRRNQLVPVRAETSGL